MALGSSHMTVTTGNVFRPQIWSPEVLRATENSLVMAPLVKRFDSLVTEKGNTINIPNLSNLSASDKSAQTQVTLQSPTEANTQISINKHKESSFLIEDILKTQANYDLSNIESFYGNVVEKVREFGEHRETTTPSRATICGRCNDYVRNFPMGKRDSLN